MLENLNYLYGNLRLMYLMDIIIENKIIICCVNDEILSDNNVGVIYGLILKC